MEKERKTIFHLDLDAFFVAVERLRDPSLIGKPVVVGGDIDGRGVVAAASYEARRYGIHSATPLVKAKRLCPHAIFVRGHHSDYSLYSSRFFQILSDYTPLIERTSIDEGYADVSGCKRLWGHPMQLAETIKLRVSCELGLSVSLGIASNKLVAKIASNCAKPEGILFIYPGYERSFLAPIAVEELPGVGPSVFEKLKGYGVKTIGDLTVPGSRVLERMFGKHGGYLYTASLGEGKDDVKADYESPKSVSREHTFGIDTNDRDLLETTLLRLTERAAADLRSKGLKARTVTLKLRFADFKTITRSRSCHAPTDLETIIFPIARSLLNESYQRRTAVRLIGIALSRLEEEIQDSLFEDEKEAKLKRLYRSVDEVRRRYGKYSVVCARGRLGNSGWR